MSRSRTGRGVVSPGKPQPERSGNDTTSVAPFPAWPTGFKWRAICGWPILAGSCLLLVACGYHTAGHAVILPQSLKTIAVPAFTNNTETYKVEQMLTAAVVRELVTRTHYRIVNDSADAADATLSGVVLSTASSPLTYDSRTGRVASVLVTVSLRVSLTDKQGKVLYQNPSYVFREQYEVSQERTSFFEENSPALERLSRNFARTLVSNILEGF
jgi:outer membrane lipopolysaccharide assembly protein LptE/RlpB